jgi:hypothetical protein
VGGHTAHGLPAQRTKALIALRSFCCRSFFDGETLHFAPITPLPQQFLEGSESVRVVLTK